MRNRRRQYAQACDPGHVCDLRSDLAKRLLREPAFGHILNRADVLKMAVLVLGPVSDNVQVLDRVVGHLEPELELHVAAGVTRSLNLFLERRSIFRMDSGTDQLQGHVRVTVKPENPIKLL